TCSTIAWTQSRLAPHSGWSSENPREFSRSGTLVLRRTGRAGQACDVAMHACIRSAARAHGRMMATRHPGGVCVPTGRLCSDGAPPARAGAAGTTRGVAESARRGDGGRFAALVATGILLSRIAGLVRQRVLAHYLGLSDAADAFTAAF